MPAGGVVEIPLAAPEEGSLPRLHFKGKVFVENHHLAVPFHSLGGKPVDWPLTVVAVVHGTPQTVNLVPGDRIVIVRDDGSRQTMRQ